ncbi:hypothetical protein [Jeotgalibacillus soli]|uniref:Uncharacterized protein n=1 Tax=Jeotgalibacillus soli TaxID=889306 RepID=A0A0C2VH00_9BACL|nr:hypothetical protein [Jeotgalibacillus soli]KIL43791.1 hypothetical protein KP78_36150 [Jeotgalibacillus soli]
MHAALVPASYHRVTANGSAIRLLHGENAPSIIEALVYCIQKADGKDKDVTAGLQLMRDEATASYKPFMENILRWQEHAVMNLQNAKQRIPQMTKPAPTQGSALFSY